MTEKRKGSPSDSMNGLYFLLLKLKDSIMETSWWLGDGSISIGDPITTTKVGEGI